ncbi:hypothetical protein FHX75_111491 [Micromonospora palomenae]|uniref:Uncharacterized protein n=1 Tax=Micromonospora palomenae TaxID=1461247 RepID=A0A561WW21_9ACTN|nr:hypothetical protein FHX75_111209 [Micromonospora palomenae]TWG28339.1 hypothetical protein FHX75_111491 [Micromonospora palomenae]
MSVTQVFSSMDRGLGCVVMNEPLGSGVLRHQPLHDGFVPAHGPQQGFAEAIDRHIEEHFGPVEFVYHEIARTWSACMSMSWHRPRNAPIGR